MILRINGIRMHGDLGEELMEETKQTRVPNAEGLLNEVGVWKREVNVKKKSVSRLVSFRRVSFSLEEKEGTGLGELTPRGFLGLSLKGLGQSRPERKAGFVVEDLVEKEERSGRNRISTTISESYQRSKERKEGEGEEK